MGQYARGKYAWGECARSGIKMRYVDMVSDGLFPNMMVHPDWYEPPYPIQEPSTVDYGDAIALRDPSPERLAIPARVKFPLYDPMTGAVGAELFGEIEIPVDAVGTPEGEEPEDVLKARPATTQGRLAGITQEVANEALVSGRGVPPDGFSVPFFFVDPNSDKVGLGSFGALQVWIAFDTLLFYAAGYAVGYAYLGAVFEAKGGELFVDMSNVFISSSGFEVGL